MERRTFLALVSGSLLAAPLAEAQPAGKIYQIGIPVEQPTPPSVLAQADQVIE